MGRPKITGICAHDGCDRTLIHARGFCRSHYIANWTRKRLKQPGSGSKRFHPFYMLWFDRKSSGCLAPEWLDFWRFIEDIGVRPEGNFLLVRPDGQRPYGPDNFKWQEHLKRKPGETRKEWWARKWAARQAANPGMERRRNLKRQYGITPEQYEAMFTTGGGLCAICRRPEVSFTGNSGTLRRLSVDHDHATGKVRELLCWSCNSVLGKVDDRPELLRAMAAYLDKHKAS